MHVQMMHFLTALFASVDLRCENRPPGRRAICSIASLAPAPSAATTCRMLGLKLCHRRNMRLGIIDAPAPGGRCRERRTTRRPRYCGWEWRQRQSCRKYSCQEWLTYDFGPRNGWRSYATMPMTIRYRMTKSTPGNPAGHDEPSSQNHGSAGTARRPRPRTGSAS
jgi:hypothetical protein